MTNTEPVLKVEPILKARSPAALAEEYIIKSIWNNYFPPGSDLPAERELAEKIGVTRTTLREVLQRLSRDGWLTIQHGKPTKVNNVWETSGLNILEVLVNLDSTLSPLLISNVLSARTNLATIYIPRAFKLAKQESLSSLQGCEQLSDDAKSYVDFDYSIFRNLAFASQNPIYGLMVNGLKGLYTRVGMVYFSQPEARALALEFYKKLTALGEEQRYDEIIECIREYGKASGKIYAALQDQLIEAMNQQK
ncbi:GntR family transcriptional regulator [Pasteurella langaaensis DSM 22999]|uniref:Fatty acid metabolism regulator protein n=1 Tax=Alitibacter langaaensis DSM 22999 TaxID=1122935 RepID=A0A2U0TGX1_9PAST|nr:fatty acid metabolism transcriptional regulator FadR [Pasteurella langaaensis]PVX42820.1 GntR family transcriptional regulator [Pasteurella langaaensis DSM 22999]